LAIMEIDASAVVRLGPIGAHGSRQIE
jgi:hypothetical protein